MATRTDRLAAQLHTALVLWSVDKHNWSKTRPRQVDRMTVRHTFRSFNRGRGWNPADDLLQECLDVLCGRGFLTPLKKTDRENWALPVAYWLNPVLCQVPQAKLVPPQWHSALAAFEDYWQTATRAQQVRYIAINRWRMSEPDTMEVPLRERALEIFGLFGTESDFPEPEKALDNMKRGPLFGDAARLHEVLSTLDIPAPLLSKRNLELQEVGQGFYQRIGKGDMLLVVENSATWWSIAAARPAEHNIGHIAWGLGRSFVSSVRSISEEHGISSVLYFGDLDRSGVEIPRAAAKVASNHRLPEVRPAVHLYADLLNVGRSFPSKEAAVEPERAAELVSWLDSDHQEAAAKLLVDGRRIAQEWVGYRHLLLTNGWHADLS
jgi:hypothetical protein